MVVNPGAEHLAAAAHGYEHRRPKHPPFHSSTTGKQHDVIAGEQQPDSQPLACAATSGLSVAASLPTSVDAWPCAGCIRRPVVVDTASTAGLDSRRYSSGSPRRYLDATSAANAAARQLAHRRDRHRTVGRTELQNVECSAASWLYRLVPAVTNAADQGSIGVLRLAIFECVVQNRGVSGSSPTGRISQLPKAFD